MEQQAEVPLARGRLYRAFIEYLLTADEARGIGKDTRACLAAAWKDTNTEEGWLRCAEETPSA